MALGIIYAFILSPRWPRGFQYAFGEDLQLSGQPDGRLVVEGPGGKWTTQPIVVRQAGHVVIAIRATDSEPPALSFLTSSGAQRLNDSDDVCEIITSAKPLSRPLSIEHPDAHKLCATWMAKRAVDHAPPGAPSPGKRLRTPTEEFQILHQQAQVLEADLVEAARGDVGRLQVVLGSLRALLYAPSLATPKKTNWHPLLFRCAAVLDMPLPVWALRPVAGRASPASIVYWDPASIEPRFLGEHLVDLQESLSWSLLTLDAPHTPEDINANMFVLKRGSADGLAHIDPEIPAWFDVMRGYSGPRGTLLVQPTLALGSIVVVLARYLHAEAARRGLT